MKKKLLVLFIAAAMCLSFNSCDEGVSKETESATDPETVEATAEVETTETASETAETEGTTGDENIKYEYDDKGRVIKEIHLKEMPLDENWYTEYVYYDNGNIKTKKDVYEYHDASGWYVENQWDYSEDGKLIREYNSSGWCDYDYDDNGLLICESGENEFQGNFRRKYEYDGNRHLIKEDFYSDTLGSSSTEYEYDENGELARTIINDDGYIIINEYSKDEDGNVLRKEIWYDENGNPDSYGVYDADGNLVDSGMY